MCNLCNIFVDLPSVSLGNFNWIVQDIPSQPLNLVFKSGGEEKTLPVWPDVVANGAHLRLKAQFQHSVSFVQCYNCHILQAGVALFYMVYSWLNQYGLVYRDLLEFVCETINE